MRRALKISAWIVGGLLGLAIALVAAVLIAGNTTKGRVLIAHLTTWVTKGHVRADGLAGSFPAAVDLGALQLSDDHGVWLTAERISLRWSPLALIRWHVRVETLRVQRLEVQRRPISTSPRSSNPSMPEVDLGQVTVDTLVLGEQLAGMPASLSVHGTAHLISLEDASADIVARRTDGEGNYAVRLRFDPARMDATLKLEEPASGPLENVLQLPGLGALSVNATLVGPRGAEQVQLSALAGALRAEAHGSVDLVHHAADLEYRLDAPAMTPHPGLEWQRVALQGRWQGSFTEPTADGHLQIEQLHIPGGTQLAALDGSLQASRGSLAVRAEVEGIVLPGSQPNLLTDTPLRFDAAVRLDAASRPVQLTASHRLFALQARAVTAGKQSATFVLRLPQLAPLAALGGQSVEGSATVQGTVVHTASSTHLDLDATADLAGADAWARVLNRGSRLQLAAALTDKRLEIERLQVKGSALTLFANGTVDRSAAGSGAPAVRALQVRWDLALANLAALSPLLAGTLKVNGQVDGPPKSLAARIQASSNLSVRGSKLGAIQANLQARGLPADASGNLQVHGSFDGAPLRIQASVERGRGDTLHAIITGTDWKSAHIEGDVTSGPALAQARGNLHLRMERLADLQRLLGMSLQGSVAGTLALTPGREHSTLQLQLDAHNVVAAGVSGNAQLKAAGPLDAMHLEVGAQLPNLIGAPASLEGAAQLNLTAHELSVARAQVSYHAQTLKLLSPARVSFAQGLSVDKLRLGIQQAILEVDGQLSAPLDLRAAVQHVDPALVNAFVPELLAQGLLSANARLKGSFAAPEGHVDLKALGLRMANDVARDLTTTDVSVSADLKGTTAALNATVSAGKGSQLLVTGDMPLSASAALNLKLTGKVDAGLANPLLEAHGQRAMGTLDVDATVTGALSAPQIGGTVHLTHGDLRDYTQGIHLADVTATAEGSEGTLRLTSLTARAAPGQISMTGTLGVLQPKIPIDLQLTAKNATPVASDLLTANLDADLHFTGDLRERLDVKGTVHLNRTDIGIPSSLPPNVAVLDVRRKGQEPPPAPERRLVIRIDVSIDAPRQILVQGRGLNAELGGNVRVHGTSDAPRVDGGFDLIRGYFSLASTTLMFTTGRVSFDGRGLHYKIDPTLDFNAQTTTADATATLHVFGVADAPQFELTSTPQLPQDEILARLLFGRPAAQLTALQAAQIGVALASLSGVGGGGLNPLVRVQRSLGLDRLSVGGGSSSGATGTENSGATIEAGRYVSDRVYVAARQSTTGTSQLQVQVDLSKHLKLQTRLGNGTATTQGTTPDNDPGSSIGISYTFEY